MPLEMRAEALVAAVGPEWIGQPPEALVDRVAFRARGLVVAVAIRAVEKEARVEEVASIIGCHSRHGVGERLQRSDAIAALRLHVPVDKGADRRAAGTLVGDEQRGVRELALIDVQANALAEDPL